MNREIKYKVWDKKTQRMYQVRGIQFSDSGIRTVYIIGFVPNGRKDFINIPVDRLYGDNFVLLQYTGLIDKVKTKVYEHDIVKYKNTYRIVLFKHGAFVAVNENGKWILLEPHLREDKAVIVGNIWEGIQNEDKEHTEKLLTMITDIVSNKVI